MNNTQKTWIGILLLLYGCIVVQLPSDVSFIFIGIAVVAISFIFGYDREN